MTSPRPFHDLRGLEQTVPPRRPPRVPSPALRDDIAQFIAMPEPEQPFQRRSPSPPNRVSPRGYSAWENRGHRSPQTSPESTFPRDRSERSMSPRHNKRADPAARTRTTPALEPARDVRLSPRQYSDQRYLQPSDARLQREREEEQRQQPWRQQQQRSSPSPAPQSRKSRSPSPQQPRLNTTPSHKDSSENVSPLSGSTTMSPPFSSHTPDTFPGEANLAKIGAPRQRRTPRAAVPSMCDYLSLDELEGLWAQQDMFVGSITAPAERPKPRPQLSLFPNVPLLPEKELGVHPAFRNEQAIVGLVQ